MKSKASSLSDPCPALMAQQLSTPLLSRDDLPKGASAAFATPDTPPTEHKIPSATDWLALLNLLHSYYRCEQGVHLRDALDSFALDMVLERIKYEVHALISGGFIEGDDSRYPIILGHTVLHAHADVAPTLSKIIDTVKKTEQDPKNVLFTPPLEKVCLLRALNPRHHRD